jgi:hypothetical protein
MAGFNFGFGDNSAVRTSKPTLAPWDIYDVEFKGCEIREFPGKKDPTASYKVLDIKFEGEKGKFTKTLFFPKDGDDVRRKVQNKNGGESELPSNFETTMAIIKQTASVLNPKGYEKLQAVSGKFKSFDELAVALVKVMDPVIGTKTQLKLVGVTKEGTVTADIPRIVSCNKEGEIWISDNFVGSNLTFSSYEDTKRKEYQGATPTKVEPKKAEATSTANTTDDKIDLADLVSGL